jgi:hypothetical protein
MKNFKNFI